MEAIEKPMRQRLPLNSSAVKPLANAQKSKQIKNLMQSTSERALPVSQQSPILSSEISNSAAVHNNTNSLTASSSSLRRNSRGNITENSNNVSSRNNNNNNSSSNAAGIAMKTNTVIKQKK